MEHAPFEKSLSEEISRWMETLDAIEAQNDEAIYDRYLKMKAQMALLSQKIQTEESWEVWDVEKAEDISKEINRWMESFENIESVSNEAIYDKYIQLKVSLQAMVQTLSAGSGSSSLLSEVRQAQHVDLATPDVLLFSSSSQPALLISATDTEKGEERQPKNRIILLLAGRKKFGLILLLCLATSLVIAILGQGFLLPQKIAQPVAPSPTPHSPALPPTETAQVPQASPSLPDPVAPVSPTPLVKEVARSISNLQKFLENRPSSEEIIVKLREMSTERSFLASDLILLQNLYFTYPQDETLRTLTIWCAGALGSEEAQKWLREVIQKSPYAADRMFAIEHLPASVATKATLLDRLSLEQDPKVCLTCIYTLSKLFSEDQEVYQALIAKFYERPEESIQLEILSTLGNIKINAKRFFLEETFSNTIYPITIRFKALEELTNYAYASQEQESLIQYLQNLSGKEQNLLVQSKIQEILRAMQKE